MAKGDYTRDLEIESLTRLKLSVNGNPRFRVTFTDGTVAQTQSDSMIAYGLENVEYRDRPLRVHFTRAGRIFAIDLLPKTGPYDGQTWATHVLDRWLNNDAEYYFPAREFAKTATVKEFARYVQDLPVSALLREDLTRDDWRTVRTILAQDVNWEYLRDSLIAE